MSNSSAGDARTKNQRRASARLKARQLREKHKKKDRRNRVLLQAGLILAALAVVTIVTLIIVNSIRPPGPGPLNMASDGIRIGAGLQAEPTGAVAAGEDPVEPVIDPDSGVITIQVWLDYQCPFCAEFEQTNAEQIETLLDENAATLEIHPISILDRASLGEEYSTRAANAAACVAQYSPNTFYAVNTLLFEEQPAEQTAGLSDEQLIDITEEAGVSEQVDIGTCIADRTFAGWVADATERATGDADLLNEDGDFSTPAVFVNGVRYTGSPDDATAFAQFVAEADGAAFSDENAASPSPSPSS